MRLDAIRFKACVLSGVCLLVAYGTRPVDAATALRYDPEGKFKIVQFTDTHWKSLEPDRCRQIQKTISSVLDLEKPDLVVLTGDIVTNGPSRKEGWKMLTEPIVRRNIPWAAVLGNHDDEETELSRTQIVEYLTTLPYSFVEEGPESLGGTGDYTVDIVGRASAGPAVVLYFLDSHAYPTIEAVDQCEDVPSKYGWLSFDQIQWYRQTSRNIRAANHGESVPALAFFHIPLPEYADRRVLKTSIGTKGETVCCGALNSGMFTAIVEEGDIMGVFVGHDHDNDYAGELLGFCLAYGRCSGAGTYGELSPGARIIELTEGQRTFCSWIRAADGPVTNHFCYPMAFQKSKAPEASPKP